MPRKRSHWLPFEEARRAAHALELTNKTEWAALSRNGQLPDRVPCTPDKIYAGEFIDWRDWIGPTFRDRAEAAAERFVNFVPAKRFARSLKLKHSSEWLTFAHSDAHPKDIPVHPERYYEGVWKGWADFLGPTYMGHQADFLPFEQARAFIHSLELATVSGWQQYLKSGEKPANIPTRPDMVYTGQWLSFGDWLGTGHVYKQRRDRFWLYRRARAYVRSLGLASEAEYKAYMGSPERSSYLPKNPNRFYAEWTTWEDWLGDAAKPKVDTPQYRGFEQAREFARSLNLKSTKEWISYRNSGKLPRDIPAMPQMIYDGWWLSFDDWLGLDADGRFLPFPDARAFVQGLKLANVQAWQSYAKSGERPANIPSNPNLYYTEWDGWFDWLGKPEPARQAQGDSSFADTARA